jgi:RNA 2',3'-cyclic 3'-phosphodiesterase
MATTEMIQPSPSRGFHSSDRLFLALFPSGPAREQIHWLAHKLRALYKLRGRPLAADRFHVSLHHLGDYHGVPADVVEAAGKACSTVAADTAPFEVEFDRVKSFSGAKDRKPLVMLENGQSAALIQLHQRLGAVLNGQGGNRKFVPHLTLLYDERSIANESAPPVRWKVEDIVLVHSLLGQSRYIELGRWTLGGDSQTELVL